MGQAIQQCGGHFGVAKHTDPFTKAQIGGDDQRGFFIELADQVKQQRAT